MIFRRLAWLVALAVVAALLAPAAAVGQGNDGFRGDPNCDGTSDIIDALVIAQFVAGTRSGVASCPLGDSATQLATPYADVDYSGDVDIIDALEVAQCTALIPNFACPLQQFEVPQPFATEDIDIGLDGFVPIPVGDRIYAIERAGNRIGCIDLATGSACWAPRSLLPQDAIGTTMAITRSAAVGDKIYFLIREGGVGPLPTNGTVRLACWDTSTDQLCPQSIDLLVGKGAALHVAGDVAYAFGERRYAHCVSLASMTTCPGYGIGLATALLTEPDWVSGESVTAWHSDAISTGDRIYATLADGGSTWLQCWDAAADAPCAGFEPSILNDTRFISSDNERAGRLFFHRSPSGDPVAICSQGERDGVDCRDLVTGAPTATAEAALATVASRISYGSGPLGISTYDPISNRQLFVGTNDQSTTYCHDFDTGSYCGSFSAFAAGAATGAYGYGMAGSCAVGLGNAGYVYFMDPGALSVGCPAPVVATEIAQCQCPATWPRLKAVQVEGLSQFLIDVRDQDFVQVALIDALAIDTFDLNEVAGGARRLHFVYSTLAAPGQDPWADNEPPTILFS